MSGSRQLPQAKYELLIENKRTGSNVIRSLLITSLLIICIVVILSTAYISWRNLGSFQRRGHMKRHWRLNSSNSTSVDTMLHRSEMYGSALKLYLDSNNTSGESVSTGANKSQHDVENKKAFKLVCYYSLPSNGTGGDLMPEEINPSLCTHLNIAFARILNGSLESVSSSTIRIYKRVAALKAGNPSLKVLLSVGGSSVPGGFPMMTATHASRKKFIRDILALLVECSLDGIDLDWEFPAWQSGTRERVHFTQLLMEIREELERRHSKLLLTVAVAAPQPIIDDSYDVSYMAQYVDFVNVMAYDYHFYTTYLPVTGHNAPLYKDPGDNGYFATLNTNYTVSYWQMKGMPKEKIVIGLPTYGHSFTLLNVNNYGVSAPASGFGSLGTNGFVSYPQTCEFMADGAATVFDQDPRVPYAFKDTEWISYDDERSLGYKAEYIVSGAYGGAMIWSLNMDDFKGECSSKEQKWFPLITKVKSVLEDDTLKQMEISLTKALNI